MESLGDEGWSGSLCQQSGLCCRCLDHHLGLTGEKEVAKQITGWKQASRPFHVNVTYFSLHWSCFLDFDLNRVSSLADVIMANGKKSEMQTGCVGGNRWVCKSGPNHCLKLMGRATLECHRLSPAFPEIGLHLLACFFMFVWDSVQLNYYCCAMTFTPHHSIPFHSTILICLQISFYYICLHLRTCCAHRFRFHKSHMGLLGTL